MSSYLPINLYQNVSMYLHISDFSQLFGYIYVTVSFFFFSYKSFLIVCAQCTQMSLFYFNLYTS